MSHRSVLTALVCAAALARPVAAEVKLEPVSSKLSVAGSLRTRGEFWSFFDPPGTANDDYAFGATVLRAAIAWKDEAFDVVVEGQNSALFDLPDDAVGAPPIGALGTGGVYFANNRATSDASVFLKQGYANLKKLGVDGLSVKGGRFEFSEGSEVLTGDATLDWLKNARLSQRLIGPFAWSHVGRSFDGVVGAFTRSPLNLTLMGSHPTQGGYDLAGMKEIGDIDLAYAAANLTRPSFLPNADARVFWIYYGDDRGLLKSDNRPLDVRAVDREDVSIHTGGAHWIEAFPTSAGTFDTLAWGAVQTGDWGRLDHHASAWDLEAGWQPAGLPWKPWLRVGYGRTSGDDDPADGDHGTFFQILPTPRIYSYSTLYNLMNDEDAFAQLLLRPRAGLVWRTDFHDVRVTEGRDLWYQGGGATTADRDVGFGFPGRPAGGHQDLMRVVETSLSYDWSQNVSTSLYYSHAFGGRVVRAIFAGDGADFGYLEATLRL